MTGMKRSNPSPDHINGRSRKISSSNLSRDTDMEEPPSVKMDPAEDNSISFIEKVRRSKELKTQSVQQSSAPSASSKLSMAAYRASRGLPPLPNTSPSRPPPPHKQTNAPPYKSAAPVRVAGPGMSNASSSLFINKRKPPVSVSHHGNKFTVRY